MKCPKCGYLGFESGDRCRNCGYEFSLASSASTAFDITLDPGFDQPRPPLDLDRIIGAPELDDAAADLPLFPPPKAEAPSSQRRRTDRMGGRRVAAEDAPLVTVPLRPRVPLGVRRSTPEVPRARAPVMKPVPVSEDMLFEAVPTVREPQPFVHHRISTTEAETPASPLRRITAGLVDLSLLSVLDAAVLYFTLRLCGLTTAELVQLPVLPLVAFFLLLNGGYFIAFTAVGGQSIGKMALGIKVIAQEDGSVPVGRATIRTLAYLVSALPFGAGFLPGIMSGDRLALHDRLAHTRVVRPSQT
jgi:uncharacterized RDD family membrane protein YckC